jgi:ParB family transcriptional regulator, chromosome partitioning protein
VNVENTFALKTIQLDSLSESATNPRRTYNPAKLQELADSIQAKGVLQPLIVRPVDDLKPYEIVAGARRYRAANLAKLEEVPCIVRNLDDKSVLEFQMIENSQRDDVGPIEEADGYARLIDDFGHTIASLAKRVGKSAHHIAARISLRDLCAKAREALEKEIIKIGHAELLARLTLDQQEEVIENFDIDGISFAPFEYTVAELREWIQRRIYTSLVTAPFPLNQKDISIGVPTCLECPKNSASQGALFADTVQAWCTDKTCYAQKVDDWTAKLQAKLKDEAKTFVQISQSWSGDRKTQALPNSAYKEVGSGDENAVEALVMDGPDKGHTKYVVLNEEAAKFLEACAKPQPEKKPAAKKAAAKKAKSKK